MARHRFAAFWATVLVVIGMLLAVGGVLLAVAAVVLDMPWGRITGVAVVEQTVAAVVLTVSGILAGAPFIVLGEMTKLFIAQGRILGRQRRLLARIARQRPRADTGAGRDEGTAAADRLLRQRRP
jgi:hypothetical protein